MNSPDPAQTYRSGPNEWGRWGEVDDIGRANLLDPAVVRAAACCIRTGERFSLALPLCSAHGAPCFPGLPLPDHAMIQDETSYLDGSVEPMPGGMKYTTDWISLACHGTTHIDALGHTYADTTIWNGAPADSCADGLTRADIGSLARKGIVGRAVLVDLPRAEGVSHLPMHRAISIGHIENTLRRQGTTLLPGDTLILRTGIFTVFYEQGSQAYYGDFAEPGLEYSDEAVEFFAANDIAGLGSDTLCNEQAHSDALGAALPMHVMLQRNLGVIFHEALWLEDWAAHCATDGRFDAFYVAAPLRLEGGSGSPMNPIVIK